MLAIEAHPPTRRRRAPTPNQRVEFCSEWYNNDERYRKRIHAAKRFLRQLSDSFKREMAKDQADRDPVVMQSITAQLASAELNLNTLAWEIQQLERGFRKYTCELLLGDRDEYDRRDYYDYDALEYL